LEMWNTQIFLEHILKSYLGIELQPPPRYCMINLSRAFIC